MKNQLNGGRIAACEQKKTREKINFIFAQTQFSDSSLKFEWEKLTPQNTRLFPLLPVSAWPKFSLQLDFKNNQNVWTNL